MVVNQSKCDFRTSSVDYLGHRRDEDGLHQQKDKIVAIVDALICVRAPSISWLNSLL